MQVAWKSISYKKSRDIMLGEAESKSFIQKSARDMGK